MHPTTKEAYYDLEQKILSLFNIKNPLNISEIVVGMYRLYHMNITRQRACEIIPHLRKAGIITQSRGVYRMKTPSLNHLSVSPTIIFDLANTHDLNERCEIQLLNMKRIVLFSPLVDSILLLLKKQNHLTFKEIDKQIFSIYKAHPTKNSLYYNLYKLLHNGVINFNNHKQYSINPSLKKYQQRYGIAWKRKYEISLIKVRQLLRTHTL
ncbi:hypothetical protein AYO45_01865 [Gammaproteobacteria bacterium SCGC AG-212-F23]|nr:hypothetical protein AYO45_01865 [Gammaproteobacteria bacterium SCGC AG-212-F23]